MSNVLRCEVAVTRDGDEDVCGKPAVGRLHLLDWEDEEFGAGEPYPAGCAACTERGPQGPDVFLY